MKIESLKAIGALYRNGLMSQEDVVAWADDKILICENIEPHIFDALMYFSLIGTDQAKAHERIHDDFSDTDDFALRISHLNFDNENELSEFNEWVMSRASLLFDQDKKAGSYGYWLAEGEFAPTEAQMRDAVNELKESYREIANAIWSRIT